MFAITPKGIGKQVGFRSIKPEWHLVEGETFTVDILPDNPVLAEDGKSLRSKTDAEMQTEADRESALNELEKLDRQSIRDIREWVSKQADAPATLVECENKAKAERAKVK
jgi:hypothetical protein